MKTYTTEELKEVCRLNELYQLGKEGGVKAYLSGADLRGAYLRGADLRGADLNSADLSCADLNGAIINWQSHTLISKLLTLWAGEDTNKLMIAGLVSVSTHLCWDGFLKIRNKHKREALEYLSTWVRVGDNAPSVLQKIKEKKVTIVQASS